MRINKVLGLLLLLEAALPASAAAQSEPEPPLFELVGGGESSPYAVTFRRDGRFYITGNDFFSSYSLCSDDDDFKCIKTRGQFLVFAIPRDELTKSSAWNFSAYNFRVLGERQLNSDTISGLNLA